MRKRGILIILSMVLFLGGINVRIAEAKTSDKAEETFSNVVLFAYFSDDAEGASYFKTETEKILEIYNGPDSSSGQAYLRYISFREYMEKISYGKFHVENIFPQLEEGEIKACQLPITLEAAKTASSIDGTIIQETIKTLPELQGKVVDQNGDGFIDNLTIVVKAVLGADENSSSLYPHKSENGGESSWLGKKVGSYNILNTGSLDTQKSGVVSHEFLHTLGYPDLYTSDGKEHPVYRWDIMGSVSHYPQYPLAYLRMHFTDWLTMDTITSSQTLTLDTQDKANGNQAYILKSPLNQQELFVVEFRKQANSQSEIDYNFMLPGSGVIVYRINPAVEGLSNYFKNNGTGVYIFRPQQGQPGYSEKEDQCIQQAYLSKESGRTSIGSSDLGKTLEDGALTFSDGTNSGIVISNVSSSAGSQMTLDVSIPVVDQKDSWTDTGFPDSSSTGGASKNVTMACDNSGQYLAAYANQKYTLYRYSGSRWSQMGAAVSDQMFPHDMKLAIHNGELYLAHITSAGSSTNLFLKKYNTSTQRWQEVAKIENTGYNLSMKSINGELYLAYPIGRSGAGLSRLNGSSLQMLGTYFDKECGQPKLCGNAGGIYVAVRNPSGESVEVYQYLGVNNFKKLTNGNISANTYDMALKGGKLYVVRGGDSLMFDIYDGSRWSKSPSSGIPCYDPYLENVQGNLYVSAFSRDGKGVTRLYHYDPEKGSYTQEGISIDGAADHMTVAASGNQMFVSYVQNLNNQIIVRTKKASADPVEEPENPPKPGQDTKPGQNTRPLTALEKQYADIYNFEYYCAAHGDIKQIFGNDPAGALQHFINYGMKEGRQACAGFNVYSYKNRYKDLRMAFGRDLAKYYQHYLNYGKREGRIATGSVTITDGVTIYQGVDYSSVYNYSYYIGKYGDLKQAYGNDDIGALEHFVNYGMKEGRQASQNFQVQSYANRYADLRRAFKNDLPSYYRHYVLYGKKEGRSATGAGTMQGYATVYQGVDYSGVYDYNYYVGVYGDIRRAFGFDDQKTLEHFVNYGMAEGRQGSSKFNVLSYRNRYKDLRMVFGWKFAEYYRHYLNYGRREGRMATGSTVITDGITVYNGVDYGAVYNYQYYINNNSDVKRAFGNDDIAVLEHFVRYGMKEGRLAHPKFNVHYYRGNYGDLKRVFGADLKEYYMHFLRYGIRERRVADRRI